MRKLLLFFCCWFYSVISLSQNCNNWLFLPSYPSYVAIGDLDIPGNQITIEAEINMTQPYAGGPTLGSDIVRKQDIIYHLNISDAVCTQYDSAFDVQVTV